MMGSGKTIDRYTKEDLIQLMRLCEDVGAEEAVFFLSISFSQIQNMYNMLGR